MSREINADHNLKVTVHQDGSVKLEIKIDYDIDPDTVKEIATSFVNILNIPFPDEHRICFVLAGLFGHDTERLNKFLSQINIAILQSNNEQ